MDQVPGGAMEEMRRSALSQISAKAGSQLPIVTGKDRGLPKAAPVFDLNELRQKNQDIAIKRVRKEP